MAAKKYMPTHDLAYCSQYNPDSSSCQNCNCNYVDIEETIILQECHAFYTVFLQLEGQLKSSGLHNSKSDVNLPTLLSVPYAVNGAFACELALKYLLVSSNISFDMAKGHNLEYLFQLLLKKEKDILTSLIKKRDCLDDSTFQDGLDSIANTLNKQRYQFSNYIQNLSIHALFNPFVHVLCEFVLESQDKTSC